MQASSSSDYVDQLANSKEVEKTADTVIEAVVTCFIEKIWVLKFKKNYETLIK
ncbi:hypothetical protein D3C73_1469470 [compost metagenome]